MGIGGSIFLIVVGAILTFAVNLHVGGVDLHIIGWILMAAGVVGLVATLWIWSSRRTVITREPTTGYRRIEEQTDYGPSDPL
jgi:hypothetical protein